MRSAEEGIQEGMVQREDTDAKQAVEVLAVNLICGLMNGERNQSIPVLGLVVPPPAHFY